MSKIFLQKLRIAASDADDLLTSCDASDLLDGLEVSRDFMFEAANEIEQLESRLAQAERERDELFKYILHDCTTCKFETSFECCDECDWGDLWQWRGVFAENTKEET